MADNLTRNDVRAKKQIKILITLTAVLSLIIFSPVIRMGIGAIFPRKPVRLGATEISIPKEWMMSRTATRVSAWKPCKSILCGSSVRASFSIELTDLPADSEEVWKDAAAKVIHRNYSGALVTDVIPAEHGTLTCLRLDTAEHKGNTVTSCLNATMGFESTFFGEVSSTSAFYGILASAQRAP